MKFIVGWDLEKFIEYRTRVVGTAGETEREWIERNPSHLIVWLEEDQIVGHAIWHASSSREHKPGDKRDKEDIEILEKLLGGNKEFIELHEVWLREEHRGKGYGHNFFEFFEKYMQQKGVNTIIYYAYNAAALTICRKRGYKEISGYVTDGIDGNLEEMSVFCLELNVKNSLY